MQFCIESWNTDEWSNLVTNNEIKHSSILFLISAELPKYELKAYTFYARIAFFCLSAVLYWNTDEWSNLVTNNEIKHSSILFLISAELPKYELKAYTFYARIAFFCLSAVLYWNTDEWSNLVTNNEIKHSSILFLISAELPIYELQAYTFYIFYFYVFMLCIFCRKIMKIIQNPY